MAPFSKARTESQGWANAAALRAKRDFASFFSRFLTKPCTELHIQASKEMIFQPLVAEARKFPVIHNNRREF
jgi:hypothetical protein